jgi:hypothetical protein
MTTPPLTVRQVHSYIGMLIAPTVIFMATTGALQVYSLHEAHGDYKPPAILETLGSLHKDQVQGQKHHDDADEAPAPAKAGPPTPAAHAEHKHEHRAPSLATALLKAFFAAVAVGLILSSSLGVWMGLKQPLRRKTYAVLLAVGTVVPLVLAVLST